MQVKKEEVKSSILTEAEKEFMEYGFEKASIRRIVKKAGTTIGNFYNYFENKEALFSELVDDEFRAFMHFASSHDQQERPDYLWETMDIAQWREVLEQFVGTLIPVFSQKLFLITSRSQGTKYENTKSILLDIITDHYIEHMRESNSGHGNSKEIAQVIGYGFLEGLLYIIEKYPEQKLRQKLINEHILFFFLGTMAMLGDGKREGNQEGI